MQRSELPLIGIFGGTFDPIHYGHLRIAEEISEMAGLRETRFIPARQPRLRHPPMASLQHRVAMVRLAIQDNSRFILDDREIRRGGISYSVESLRELKQELEHDAMLCFIMGADAFMKLAQWHSWRDLFGLCHFIIAARPGHTLETYGDALPRDLKEECARRWVSNADSLKQASSGLIFFASTTLLDISATLIRGRVAGGKSIRYLTPNAALDYIEANHLYSEKK